MVKVFSISRAGSATQLHSLLPLVCALSTGYSLLCVAVHVSEPAFMSQCQSCNVPAEVPTPALEQLMPALLPIVTKP